jgi:plastocyanin/uncharacterized protein YdeI (BOF family)
VGVSNIPPGAVQLSFDVYDVAGNVSRAPGGYRTVYRPAPYSNCGAAVSRQPVRLGDRVNGHICTPGQRDTYVFDGTAGQEITVELHRTSSNFNAYLELLRDDDGRMLAENDDVDGSDNSRIRYTLPVSARYRIVARGYESPSYMSTGTYLLLLTGNAPVSPPPRPAPPDMSVPAVPQAGMISITAGGFRPSRIEVPTGTRVVFVSNAGRSVSVNSDPHPTHMGYPPLNLGEVNPGSSLQVVMERPGTFGYHNHFAPDQRGTIVVTGSQMPGSGPSCSPRTRQVLQATDFVRGNICTPEQRDTYVFDANAGSVVTIAMNREANTGLDPFLELEGPSLAGITDDDSGGDLNARIVYTLPANGRYTIVARSCCGTTGVYTLSVAVQSGGRQPAPPGGNPNRCTVNPNGTIAC